MSVKEIFFIRCISCLSVVLIHAIALVNMNGNVIPIDIPIETLLMFSTPSFVFISEFLLAYSYPEGTPKGFLRKRFQFIFLPFICIGVIDALMMGSQSSGSRDEFFQRILANIFLGNYIGYFVLIIFQFYVLHMFFHRFLSKASPRWVLPLSFLITGSYLFFIKFLHIPVSLPNSAFKIEWLPFIGWLFYFCLAYYCGKDYKKFIIILNKYRYWMYILLAFSLLTLLGNTHLGFFEPSSKRPDVLLYTTSIVFLLFHIFSKVKKVPSIVITISNYSFSIYLLHMYFFGIALITKEISWQLTLVLAFTVGVIGPIVISWVVNKFRYGYMLVGRINKPKNKTTLSQ
ncbi:acyltransferase family protein [Priestia filamentosa]|uniref:acyltransferase family protein n=1 Tax=Priestia filamentosa TaxID=1402861 RepID=UPI002E250134|nr:acyltransferase family protein [Priestia filamentosa]MED3729310.1 acyltransferase family protein [Priestia filamentosa]